MTAIDIVGWVLLAAVLVATLSATKKAVGVSQRPRWVEPGWSLVTREA